SIADIHNNVGSQPGMLTLPANPLPIHFSAAGSEIIQGGLCAYVQIFPRSTFEFVQIKVSTILD
ncbi:hypothetical protein SOVF_147680, partial [Spinacia oleracea]